MTDARAFRVPRPGSLRLVVLVGVAALVSLVSLTGCRYVPDRLRDLADIGRVSAGPCIGLGVEVKATGLLHPSLGIVTRSARVGWDSRHCYLFWPEREAFFPMSIPRTAAYEAATLHPVSAAMPAFYARRSRNPMQDCTSISRLFFSPPPGRRDDDLGVLWRVVSTVTDFEAGAALGIVSARVGVNAAEIVDFVLGFFMIDIAGDDGATMAARKRDAGG